VTPVITEDPRDRLRLTHRPAAASRQRPGPQVPAAAAAAAIAADTTMTEHVRRGGVREVPPLLLVISFFLSSLLSFSVSSALAVPLPCC
jgi:hypothetical protein